MKKLLLAVVVMTIACSSVSTPTPAPAAPPAAGGKPVAAKNYSAPPPMSIDPNKDYRATIKTNQGDIKAQLFAKDSPTTVNNFVYLAKDHFYDGVKFHRIIKGFMVQTGDPQGTGGGGPGYTFKDELDLAKKNGYKKGTLAMANRGPNTNGSQFFIMDADYGLPPNYSVFGQVTDGQDVVAKIASSPVRSGAGGENSQPTTDLRIDSVTVEER